MIIIEYPVALVLKGWHSLFHSILGISAYVSWIMAVIFLVLTVRGLLMPLMLRQIRSSRNLANLRPRLFALSKEYEGKKDKKSQAELQKKRRAMQKEGNYRVRDGCLPSLIQVPVFIGLYRMLLRVARPNGVVDPDNLHGFGPLSDQDVATFMHARIFGVPLISYVQMPAQSLTNLGTDRPSVFHVAVPMVLTAAKFTAINITLSIRRYRMTMDYSQKSSFVILGLFRIMRPIVILLPVVLGMLGPLPVVVFVYWVTNNLCTLTVTQSVHMLSDRTHPYSEEFHEHNAMQREQWEQKKAAKKGSKASKAAARSAKEKAEEQAATKYAQEVAAKHAELLASQQAKRTAARRAEELAARRAKQVAALRAGVRNSEQPRIARELRSPTLGGRHRRDVQPEELAHLNRIAHGSSEE